MKNFVTVMVMGTLGLTAGPAFAQSASSESSSSVSSASSESSMLSSSWMSSSSLSSAPIYSPSSRSSSSSSLTRTQERIQRRIDEMSSSSSSESSVRSRVTRSSSQGSETAYDQTDLIPKECRDLMGRARGRCVIRLTHPDDEVMSSSSSSRSSVGSGTGGMMNVDQAFGTLLRMTVGEASRLGTMRELCGLVMGEYVSTCATGEANLQEFNRHLHTWFLSLGTTLGNLMRELNPNEATDAYFWNDETFMPLFGTGSWMSGTGSWMSGSGSDVRGWNDMWNLWDIERKNGTGSTSSDNAR